MDGVVGVVQIGLLPPVPLFEVVLEAEGRLFLDDGVHPLDGLARRVEVLGRDPVLADAAVELDVEADLAFDGGVDHPAAAFGAQLAAVELRETPAHFHPVVRDAQHVEQVHEQVFGLVLFGLGYLPVGEGGFLVLAAD